LKLVWRWKPAIGPAPSSLGGTAQSNGDPTLAIYKSEATPIMANGVLYESAGGQRVVAAIDAATGKQLWLWKAWTKAVATVRRPAETQAFFA
jgi:glucose dehydrogenase